MTIDNENLKINTTQVEVNQNAQQLIINPIIETKPLKSVNQDKSLQNMPIAVLNDLLVKAVENKAPAMIKYFVDLGANINAHNRFNKPLLIIAIENDDYASVREILIRRANPDINYLANPALFLATSNKKLINGFKMAVQLLKYGAKVDCTSEQGYTPLLYAVSLGMENFVELFVRYNANKYVTINGMSLLQVAMGNNYQNIVNILNGDFKHLVYSSDAFLEAVQNNQVLFVHYFVKSNKNEISELIKRNPILLHIAVANEGDEIVDLLIEHGVDINSLHNGVTALYTSSHYGYSHITSSLLDAGADTEIIPPNHCSALCRAIVAENEEDVRLLLAHKAKVIYDNNFSPLSISQQGNPKIAKLILDYYRENLAQIRKENNEYTIKYDESGRSFHVVMIRFKEEIVHEEFPSCNVTVYNKGDALSLPKNYKVIDMDNTGYLGGPFLDFVIDNYNKLPDTLLLVQGNPHDNPYIRFPIEEQYKGKLQSTCDNIIGICVESTLARENSVLQRLDWDNSQYSNFDLGDFNLVNFVHEYVCPYITPTQKIRLNYGSQAAFKKEFFLSQPIEYWKHIRSSYNGTFPIVDHGFERSLDIMGGGCKELVQPATVKMAERKKNVTYAGYPKEAYSQEGIDYDKKYPAFMLDALYKLQHISDFIDNDNQTKIPLITHQVYLTYNDDPKEIKIIPYKKTIESLNILNSVAEFKHYIWTNEERSIPQIFKDIKGVEIHYVKELAGYRLFSELVELISQAQKEFDIGKFTMASDVLRVIAVREFGGVYRDLDHQLYAPSVDVFLKFMKIFNFMAGIETKWLYSSAGNAFFAATPHHPVMEEASYIQERNLHRYPDTPDYVKYPYSKFELVIYTTSPSAFTMAIYKAANKTGNHDVLMPYKVFFNTEYAWATTPESRCFAKVDKDYVPSLYSEQYGVMLQTVGADMSCGDWFISSGYNNPIDYQI